MKHPLVRLWRSMLLSVIVGTWVLNGGRSFFMFVVLPFGSTSAPYVFTKMKRPLVRLWRSKRLKAIVYLDDGIVAVRGNLPCLGPLLCPKGEEWAPFVNAVIV